ncbi:MAG: DUF2723 domain-containing protein [Myxococcales bacterium]|nr:DUF2723 domain-containing protein [Myxococcales bacterium]
MPTSAASAVPVAQEPFARADRLLALVLGALVLCLYALTLCRSVYWYDSAEYVTAAYTLGVAHPPGYPLYILLARAFLLLPLPPATAVNALSAVAGAGSAVLLYALGRELGAARPAAFAAALLWASAPAVWFNASVAEVYLPGMCFTLAALWLLLRAERAGRPLWALAASALSGAALGVHYSIATCGLGFAWLAVASVRGRGGVLRGWLLRFALAVLAGALWVYLYVLLRASSDAVPNAARPGSPARLLWLVSGGNYRQWFSHGPSAARSGELLGLLGQQLAWAGALLGVAGLAWLVRRQRTRGLALASAIVGNVAFFYAYRVHDLEVFLLPTVALGCALSALALSALPARGRLPWLGAAALASLALFRIAGDYEARDLSGFREAHDYGERLVAQLPHRAVLLNYTTPEEWRRDAVFGMYVKHVLGRRPDVIVVNNAGRAVLDRLLLERRDVYLYAPLAHVAAEYQLRPEGELQRIVGRR